MTKRDPKFDLGTLMIFEGDKKKIARSFRQELQNPTLMAHEVTIPCV